MSMQDKMRPVHPGEIFREDVLAPLGMSARQFALAIGVPANRVSQILASDRAVTADTALRIARLRPGRYARVLVAPSGSL